MLPNQNLPYDDMRPLDPDLAEALSAPQALGATQTNMPVSDNPKRLPLQAMPGVAGTAPSSAQYLSRSPNQPEGGQQPEFVDQGGSNWNWERAIIGGLAGLNRQNIGQALAGYDQNQRSQMSFDAQRRSAQSLVDPNSEASSQAREGFRQQMTSRADLLKDRFPQLAEQFTKAADQAATASAARIAQMTERMDQIMGESLKVLDMDMKANVLGAQLGLKQQAEQRVAQTEQERLGIARQGLGLEAGRLDLARQAEARKGMQLEMRSRTPPKDIMKTLREVETDTKDLERALQLFDAGKAPYTGTGAGAVRSLKNMADSALSVIGSDKRTIDPEQAEFTSVIGRLGALARKPIYGAALAAFDIKDSTSWVPGESDAGNVLRQKLQNALRVAKYQKQLLEQDRDAITGDPMGSRIVEAWSDQPAGGIAAPRGAPAGKTIQDNATGKIFKVSDDGKTMTEVK